MYDIYMYAYIYVFIYLHILYYEVPNKSNRLNVMIMKVLFKGFIRTNYMSFNFQANEQTNAINCAV